MKRKIKITAMIILQKLLIVALKIGKRQGLAILFNLALGTDKIGDQRLSPYLVLVKVNERSKADDRHSHRLHEDKKDNIALFLADHQLIKD